MDVKTKMIFENEQEWRRTLFSEISEIRRELTGLRIRVAVIASTFSLIVSLGTQVLIKAVEAKAILPERKQTHIQTTGGKDE